MKVDVAPSGPGFGSWPKLYARKRHNPRPSGGGLVRITGLSKVMAMWTQPYLETCCRAALHRVYLSAEAGRPPGLADDPCLRRLMGMGLCDRREDGRFEITHAGRLRHATEVLRLPANRTDL